MTVQLDPDAASLLGSWAAAARGPVETQPVATLRTSGLINPDVTGPAPSVARVEDLEIAAAHLTSVRIRVYQPGAAEGPVLVYAHGGGWTCRSGRFRPLG